MAKYCPLAKPPLLLCLTYNCVSSQVSLALAFHCIARGEKSIHRHKRAASEAQCTTEEPNASRPPIPSDLYAFLAFFL